VDIQDIFINYQATLQGSINVSYNPIFIFYGIFTSLRTHMKSFNQGPWLGTKHCGMIWKGLDDDNPVSQNMDDTAYLAGFDNSDSEKGSLVYGLPFDWFEGSGWWKQQYKETDQLL
jgi:hypothetical protein